MKLTKVNNLISFFILRYLFIIFFCFLTIYVTGRIADMDILLGWRETDVGGVNTSIAINLFSIFSGLRNRYLIIFFLGLFVSLINFLLLSKHIDKNNIYIWKIILLVPGVLIYTNSPTKETLFIYPTILFLILECNYITGKSSIDFVNFFFKLPILFIMFLLRGDLALPYVFLSLISLILKNFKVGKIYKKLRINLIIFRAFILSIFTNIFIGISFPNYIKRISTYLIFALDAESNNFRPNDFINPFAEPLKLLFSQYLALFPTLGELLNKPYLILIILDSIMLIYCFVKSWSNLFDLLDPYHILKKIVSIIFIYVAIVYFSFFSIIGSINLGASQRFRVNYIPLGIMFPLLLEKKIRDKLTTFNLKRE